MALTSILLNTEPNGTCGSYDVTRFLFRFQISLNVCDSNCDLVIMQAGGYRIDYEIRTLTASKYTAGAATIVTLLDKIWQSDKLTNNDTANDRRRNNSKKQ